MAVVVTLAACAAPPGAAEPLVIGAWIADAWRTPAGTGRRHHNPHAVSTRQDDAGLLGRAPVRHFRTAHQLGALGLGQCDRHS
ncbi:hypothetical protein OG613_45435 (plasmid) [Streptomyces sp. NBC_00015]|uniref:hypothetical protein n=1 Tax=unclassified Streptomyces TaxID=2593676 RepID=UPI002F90F4CB